MQNKLSFRIGNFLYKQAFPVYSILYKRFKQKQDAGEIAILRSTIKKGDHVLDIGSNIGFYAAIISELVGDSGLVHCFEPDKQNFSHLKKQMSGLKNAVLNNVAVSDNNGTITIYTSHRLNVDHRTYKPEVYDDSYEVSSIVIDDYLKNKHPVSFIKMDIQGAEYLALKGMEQTLRNSSVTLLAEFWPFGLISAGTSAKEVLDFMHSLGYSATMNHGRNSIVLTTENLHLVGYGENDYCNVIFKKQ